LQAYPFRMTPQNMARYKDDENYSFWTMIKEGYDHFELTKVPPKVDVCGRNYVFNRLPTAGQSFRAAEACPASSMPDTLTASYKALQQQEKAVFDQAVARANGKTPMDSILGPKEASLVADWSMRRA